MTSSVATSPALREAPGARGVPYAGAMLGLRFRPLDFLLERAARFGDVAYLGDIGPRRAFLVNHPDLVKYVVQENTRVYDKGVEFRAFKPVTGDGLVASRGELWRRQRRLIQPAFHRQRLAELLSGMAESVAGVIAGWERHVETGQPLDLVGDMKRLTQIIVVRSMFSADISADAGRLIPAWNRVTDEVTKRLWSVFPFLDDLPTPGNLAFKASLKTLDDIVLGVIAERRRTGEKKPDVLTMLSEARDEETGEAMSDRQLRDELMTIFFGGQETTTNALGFVWYLLSKHPEVERRVAAEVFSVLGDRPPTAEDLPKLTYTRMVIDEMLRLCPPVWTYTRVAQEDDAIGGFHIPEGSSVFLSPWTMHRNPAFWDNPEGFDPERFRPEAAASRPRYAYFPFGGGPRLCIGNNFVLAEIQIALAMIVQRYRLSLVSGTKMELAAGMALAPKGRVLMTVERRSRPA